MNDYRKVVKELERMESQPWWSWDSLQLRWWRLTGPLRVIWWKTESKIYKTIKKRKYTCSDDTINVDPTFSQKILCKFGYHDWYRYKTKVVYDNEQMSSKIWNAEKCVCCDKYNEWWT